MALSATEPLDWCTEDIPASAGHFYEFIQPLTDPLFLSPLSREYVNVQPYKHTRAKCNTLSPLSVQSENHGLKRVI